METVTELELAELCALCRDRLSNRGFSVEQCVDFEKAVEIVSDLDKPYTTRHLWPEHHDFTQKSAFWIFVKFEEEYVGCVGVRYDDIGGEHLHNWWSRQAARLYGGEGRRIIADSPRPAFLDQVNGKLVYVGDLFVSRDARVTRRLELRVLMFLVYSLCALRWDFDWIYSFIKEKHARRGFTAVYCASHQYPGVKIWSEEPPERDSTEWFSCSSAKDFFYLARYYLTRSDLL